MIKQFSILTFVILILASCESTIEREVYFSVNSQYCKDCELIVNGHNLGKLKMIDIDQFETKSQLDNSKLLKTTLGKGDHEIVVVSQKDTINHITWTLKSDGKWQQKGHHVNISASSFSKGTTIKNIENSILIELTNK